jgi:magnesium chelatase family protein
MKNARAWSVALVGLDATLVEVEVSFGSGLPHTVIVGLGDTAVKEARERCRAAVSAAGFGWPPSAVTINLTPATLPKAGSHYDLPIVIAVLAAAASVPRAPLEGTVFLGELGLDGRVRAVRGVLPALLAARQAGFGRAVVPASQLHEARLVDGLQVAGVGCLGDAVSLLRGEPYAVPDLPPSEEPVRHDRVDLADVVGQVEGRWALEVAAAGGHHLLMTGPPGVGKTLLAERLPGLLPELTLEEALEVSAIHSLSGRSLEGGLITRPPYADPHHSASLASLVGGGSLIAKPGAVSRAHYGVLFLDEAPEFSSAALEALRTPMESGRVVLARAKEQTTYPARFQLVLASNPCPCGWYNVEGHGARCGCPPQSIKRYLDRLSGPILDRIDIQLGLRPSRLESVASSAPTGESSAVVAERVLGARLRQRARWAEAGYTRNADVPGPMIRRSLRDVGGLTAIDDAVRRGQLSARGVDKVLRLAWTVSDLMAHDRPEPSDIHTALGMRRGESEEVRCA